MALFKIGQRIKKVRGPFNVGVTGTVLFKKDGLLAVRCDMVWWAYQERRERPRGSTALFDPEHCEPILPDGAKPSEYKTVKELLSSLQGELVRMT